MPQGLLSDFFVGFRAWRARETPAAHRGVSKTWLESSGLHNRWSNILSLNQAERGLETLEGEVYVAMVSQINSVINTMSWVTHMHCSTRPNRTLVPVQQTTIGFFSLIVMILDCVKRHLSRRPLSVLYFFFFFLLLFFFCIFDGGCTCENIALSLKRHLKAFWICFLTITPHLEYWFLFSVLNTKAAFAKAAFDTPILYLFRCVWL